MKSVSQRSVRLRLASHPEAPAQARDFLAASCEDWGVPEYLEPGSLAVSELVTNAVQHAGTDIDVDLTLTHTGLVVAVGDRGDGRPVVVPPHQRLIGGRGLAMVAKISDDWGVEAAPEGGKTVWCRLAVPRY